MTPVPVFPQNLPLIKRNLAFLENFEPPSSSLGCSLLVDGMNIFVVEMQFARS